MKNLTILLFSFILLTSAEPLIADDFVQVEIERRITQVQPMTGLVLWRGHDQMDKYSSAIALEFAYCLPCKVVVGKKDGVLQYDWSYLEEILNDIALRNHQAVIRFRYENPGNTELGTKGATAVPQYIKEMDDYKETSNSVDGSKTYYADWSHDELKWFTKQFITDFNAEYAADPRIAVVQLGFGHWSEGHIYGTDLQFGVNFPTKQYQAEYYTHVSNTLEIPWGISISGGDDYYSPIPGNEELLQLNFGAFDDSFMHEGHELSTGEGWNEYCWDGIGKDYRWIKGICGGEISYYTSNDQKNFLNPDGMYGWTWEEASAKYHISYMLSNNAPGSKHATIERFREAGIASGYTFRVGNCRTNGTETRLTVCNMGVAPIYRDAYFAIGSVQSEQSLRGLLPGEMLEIVLPVGLNNVDDLQIVSPYVLPSQQIEFEAGVFTDLPEINTPSQMVNTQKLFRNGQLIILRDSKTYSVMGQEL
jgi:hypothetical protein